MAGLVGWTGVLRKHTAYRVKAPGTRVILEVDARGQTLLGDLLPLDFAAILGCRDWETVKARLKERQVHRFRSGSRWVYVKRYFSVPIREVLRDLLCLRPYRSGAGREWLALRRLEHLGIPTQQPLAYGEVRRFGIPRAAFLLTDEVAYEGTLEDLAQRASPSHPLVADRARRSALICRLAALTRRMHDGGLNHRDYYLGHITWRYCSDGSVELVVMDLNRADVRTRVGQRWRVKDLAALAVSAPATRVTRTDRLRFLRAYLGAGSGPEEIRQWSQLVESKAATMRAHIRRRVSDGAPNFHLNAE